LNDQCLRAVKVIFKNLHIVEEKNIWMAQLFAEFVMKGIYIVMAISLFENFGWEMESFKVLPSSSPSLIIHLTLQLSSSDYFYSINACAIFCRSRTDIQRSGFSYVFTSNKARLEGSLRKQQDCFNTWYC
jgi:hypothetical protein